MLRRVRLTTAIALATAAVLAVSCSTATPSSATRPLAELLRSYGFAELRPPSTLTPPGTIVLVRQERPLLVSTVCSQSTAVGSLPIASSAAPEALVESVLKSSFAVAADYMEQFRASAGTDRIRSVEYTLRNVRLLEISDEQVWASRDKRAVSCQMAVEERLRRNDPITMIKGVFQADAEFRVRVNGTADAEADLTSIAKAVSADATAAVQDSQHIVITAPALFWGVIDDADVVLIGTSRGGQFTGIMPILPATRKRLLTEGAGVRTE